MIKRFSVVIPLYNKEREIASALRSVASQTLAPCEVIVVDDGSTDRSAQIVAQFEGLPLKLIGQTNGGVAAARNRGIAEASGDYIALLDADDRWQPEFLAEIGALIDDFPDCAIYSSAFEIESANRLTDSNSPNERGIVADFWTAALRQRICNSSNSVIPRSIFEREGGFPEGMRLGEDQYMWIKAATAGAVCFTPKPLAVVSATASNRSERIYSAEHTAHSFEELYDSDGDTARNEFIARCAIGKAITLSTKGDTAFGRRTERFFGSTRLCRRALCRLRILNRLPKPLRAPVHSLYRRLAWALVRRGE